MKILCTYFKVGRVGVYVFVTVTELNKNNLFVKVFTEDLDP